MFVGGVIILLIGVWLQFSNQISEGFYYSRFGYGDNTAYPLTINGFSAFIIGFILLAFSICFYWSYKQEKKKWSEEGNNEGTNKQKHK